MQRFMSALLILSVATVAFGGSIATNEIDDRHHHAATAKPVARQDEDEESGSTCVTNDGRSGRCVERSSCKTNSNNDQLAVCYRVPGTSGQTLEFVCCPKTDRAGVTPAPITGCGRRNVAPIVGGESAVPNSWPWAVAIFQRSSRDPTKRQFICGGSIINRRFIMTAAHCVVRYEGMLKAISVARGNCIS